MPSYVERSNMVEAGLKSKHYPHLAEWNAQGILSEEQLAIMALICDKARYGLDIEKFTYEVIAAQSLMPANGRIRSRQILCLIARMVGIE